MATFNWYDPMGRVTEQYEYTPLVGANGFPFPYAYDLMGNMTSKTNGFFNGLYFNYNSAGRLGSFTSSGYEIPPPTNLLTNAHYNAAGLLVSDTLGTGEVETYTYDKRLRLQAVSSQLGSSPIYSFSLSFAPNGDVLSSSDSVNGNYNYSYDQFNRLVCTNLAANGSCSSPTNGTPTYTYIYDRFGNRWQQNGPAGGPYHFSATFTGNGTTNNNRMDGFSYDTAGNLLNDGVHQYYYDAENRIIQVNGTAGVCASGLSAGTTACYYYDAQGHRVHRTGVGTDPCDPQSIGDFAFDLDGHWTTQANNTGGACNGEIYIGQRHLGTASGVISFNHADWLGTTRLWNSATYPVYNFSTCTSLPFGDGLNCSANQSYLHFTGKEHDFETGLENFGPRHDASSMGRFMSPDPGNAGVVNADPQSWNAYSYVRNNPVNLTDPTGAVFCRAAGAGDPEGVTQVCDVTDADYVNSSKEQQAAYDKAGYTHFDCSCDTGADKDAWQHQNGNASNDYVGDALVFLASFAGLEGYFYPQLHPNSGGRLPQDIDRQNNYPEPPDPNGGNGTIGTNPNQDAALRRDIQQAQDEGATDIRVNQEQTDAQRVRVGQNRPDLQYTDKNGIRHYIEYDQDPASGAAHAQRIRANDPAGIVTTKTVK